MDYRAAVLHEVGKPLVIERVAAGKLRRGDVLVRLGASGLCHTDLEAMQGSLASPLPVVLGHEGAGVVEAVGEGVSQVAVGDHVVCSWNPHCGHCFYCERGQPILCEPYLAHGKNGRLLDGETRLTLGGKPLHHFMTLSAHGEYCVVAETSAIRVPKEIPFDRACLIGCGVMTGVGAASRFAQVQSGASVAVIGCGAVGLNCLQGARIQGADTIIAVDTDPAKFDLARTCGATHAIQAGGDAKEALETVMALTGGRGVDYAFECVGAEASLQLMLDFMRPGGQAVILGKTNVNKRVSLRFGSLMGEKRITRSSYGGARPVRDFPWLAKLYLEGKLMLDELISRRIRLEDINAGFESMTRGEIVRAVITLPG